MVGSIATQSKTKSALSPKCARIPATTSPAESNAASAPRRTARSRLDSIGSTTTTRSAPRSWTAREHELSDRAGADHDDGPAGGDPIPAPAWRRREGLDEHCVQIAHRVVERLHAIRRDREESASAPCGAPQPRKLRVSRDVDVAESTLLAIATRKGGFDGDSRTGLDARDPVADGVDDATTSVRARRSPRRCPYGVQVTAADAGDRHTDRDLSRLNRCRRVDEEIRATGGRRRPPPRPEYIRFPTVRA